MSGTDIEKIADAQLERIAHSTDLDRVARLGLWLAAAESNSNDPKAKGMAAALRIGYAESLGLPAHAPAVRIARSRSGRCAPASRPLPAS